MNLEYLIFAYLAVCVLLWLMIRAIWFWFIKRDSQKQLQKTLNDPSDKYYLRGWDATPNYKGKRAC